jgi:TM2 domain-containing membrane protein YozV
MSADCKTIYMRKIIMSDNATNIATASKSALTSDQKICNSCNSIIKIKAEICPHCGVRQRNPVSKTALLLITFFLGSIGAHKFYLGKNWQGVLYLLFCWTGITGLIALVEFIIYAFTSSDSLNEKYSADGSAVVIVLVAVGFVFMIGILAAIAIPAYNDYLVRAKVAQGLFFANGAKEIVTTNAANATPFDTGWTAPSATDAVSSISINPANGEITISYSEKVAPADKNTLILSPRDKETGNALTLETPATNISWSCNSSSKANAVNSGTLGRIVPVNCR